MRARGARLQLLPEQALPEVPESVTSGVDRGAAGTNSADKLLPRRVHAAAPELKALIIRVNQWLLYDVLLEMSSPTLLEFGHSRLRAQVGITTVLHTWSRDLRFHPHAHCIVTAGGLALDQSRWTPARSRYLFPVTAMSIVFRGKFLAAVQRACDENRLVFAGACAELKDRAAFRRWLDKLYKQQWVVYAKPPFGGPEQMFNYLGPDTPTAWASPTGDSGAATARASASRRRTGRRSP